MTGRSPDRVSWSTRCQAMPCHGQGHHAHDEHTHHHGHRHWSDIRASLLQAGLPPAVRDHAIGIFAALAEAEGRVHGVAAGRGRVPRGRRGRTPSPTSWPRRRSSRRSGRRGGASRPSRSAAARCAPRTGSCRCPRRPRRCCWKGSTLHDDGIGGERVTPTGAAILRYLRLRRWRCGRRHAAPVRLSASAPGGCPGPATACARWCSRRPTAAPAAHRELAVISFEVDDQSGEDLAPGSTGAGDARGARRGADAGVRQESPAGGARAGPRPARPARGGRCASASRRPRRSACAPISSGPRAGPAVRQRARSTGHAVHGEAGGAAGRRLTGKAESDHLRDVPATPPGPAPAQAEAGGAASLARSAAAHEPGWTGCMPPGDTGPDAVAVSGGIDSLTLATAPTACRARVTMHHAASPAVPAEATARTRRWRRRRAGRWTCSTPASSPTRPIAPTRSTAASSARPTCTARSRGARRTDRVRHQPRRSRRVPAGAGGGARHGVRHPFVEAAIDKRTVRALALELGLGALSDLPSAPCLSSRIETGIRIEAAVLAMVHRRRETGRAEAGAAHGALPGAGRRRGDRAGRGRAGSGSSRAAGSCAPSRGAGGRRGVRGRSSSRRIGPAAPSCGAGMTRPSSCSTRRAARGSGFGEAMFCAGKSPRRSPTSCEACARRCC